MTDRYILILATIGTFWLIYRACSATDSLADWLHRRRRSRPVQMAPLPRVVAVPAKTRREHPAIWPTN
jgi:hypothetical protein